MSEGIVVIGAGGHAKVVVATLEAAGLEAICLLDDNPELWGSRVLGVEVRGPLSSASEFGSRGVLAIGSNRNRERLSTQISLKWQTAVHPDSWVHPSVRLGPGTVVFAGVVIQPGTVVGSHVIVNTGSSIDHDCEIGDFVHIAPGANLAGEVLLGEGVFMGMGSCVISGLRVGRWSVVGAGAAVVKNLPAEVTAVGVPAREAEPSE